MTDQAIWDHLTGLGAIQPSWWYSAAVIPASLLAVLVYLLIWFLLARRREHLIAMLLWLMIASLPILIILPSLYARLAIGGFLERLGLARPAFAQEIAFSTAHQLQGYLNLLGWLGAVGMALSIVLLVVGLLRSGVRYVPPIQRRTIDAHSHTQHPPTQAYSGVVTATFERRPNPRLSAPYGVMRVISGERKGTHFGITGNMLIGSHKANLTVNDRIVSGRHARIDIRDTAVYLIDEGSRNGTYVRRNGKITEALSGQPVLLEPDDTIILGNPDLPEAVHIIYDRPPAEDDQEQIGEFTPEAQP